MAEKLYRGGARPDDARPMETLHAVPLLSLPGVVLLPGTLAPLHAFEPAPCRVLSAALADRRLVVVAAFDPPAVATLARIVSDRRYPDGRLDAFVHGLERARVVHVHDSNAGPACSLVAVADLAYRGDAGRRLRQVAQSLVRALEVSGRSEEALALGAVLGSTREVGVLANRLAGSFVTAPEERQGLLEVRCPGERAAWLTKRLGEVWLEAVPAVAAAH